MTARRFGPVEIIDAGTRDSRETFAWLYVELDRVRAASAWVWHRAFVDPAVPLLDGVERLPCHRPAPGFGGQDLARRPVPIAVDRLTDDGVVLYAFGVRLAAVERAVLERALEGARIELEALRAIPDRATRQRRAAIGFRKDQPARPSSPLLSAAPIPWPDVPVRVPGTDRYLAPGIESARADVRPRRLEESNEAAYGAGMPRGDVETFHENGAWHNRIEGTGETIGGAHNTRDAAIAAGRAEAERRKVEHIVHNLNGQIGDRSSHGNDPRNIPG